MTTDLERRLTAALHERAEDAMTRTHTEEELLTFLERTPQEDRRRQRRRWVAGGAVAAAALAVAGVSATYLGESDTVAGPSSDSTAAVQTATRFLDAYASFDRGRAASYLAKDASLAIWLDATGNDAWRPANRWLEATGFQMSNESCQPEPSTPMGTPVHCTFDYQHLHSEQLGRGPFSGNTFDFRVDDGKIVAATQLWAFATNGYAGQMWEPFAKWVARTYPHDARVMYADWPGQAHESLTERSIALWQEHAQEYVDAQTG